MELQQLSSARFPVPAMSASRIQTHPEHPLSRKPWLLWWSVVLITLSIAGSSLPAFAFPGGVSGYSGKSGTTCTSCHSSGTTPSITLTGPTSVASGSTNSYTLTVGGSGNGGLDVAASAGTFTAGTGTQVQSGEITQTSATSTHSWTFSWTAPTVTANTTATIYAAAVDGFSGGTGTLQQAITVTAPVTAPTLTLSPATLSFSYQSGGTVPASQNVSATSSGSAISYTVSTSATWLTATPTSGSTTGTIAVGVSPSGLAAGTYTGTVTVTGSSASNSPRTVAVTLTVTAAPVLPTINASPASLSFTYQSGGATPAAQPVSITSSGTAFSFTAGTTASWLTVSPASGNSGSSVSVAVNPSGLAAGSYSGNVTITASGASNSPKTIPVSLTVTAAALPTLGASPLTLSFNYQSGGAAPAAQSVNLTSSSGTLSYTAASSATWLTASPASGSAPGSLSIGVIPSGLAAGSYSGTVTITSAGASNSPQKVTVTLTVTATPPTNPSLAITPGNLSFTYAAGSTTSGSQNLSISSTNGTLNFSATAAGGSWLSVSPASGSTPATLKVSINAGGMTAGTYNGSITLTSTNAANSPQTVPVQLVITSTTGTGRLRVWPSRAVLFDYQSGQAPPSARSIRVTSNGKPLSFTAATYGGTWVSVTPSGGTTPGTLSVSVDPTGMASGTYSATIKLTAQGAPSLNVPVTLRVVSGDDGGGESDDSSEASGTGSSEDGLHAWPYAYDPAGTNTVAATWIDSTGASTTATADSRQQGLLLSKTSAASNQAQAGVVIRSVENMSLTELGYDIRNGGQCTAKSPRFVVVTSDDVVHKVGCVTGTSQPAPAAGWRRLRFDPANAAQTVPAIQPGSKVKSIHLVLDDGPESGSSLVVLDNIDINGTLIGKQ